jgi:transposase
LEEAKEKKRTVYFVDAAHFVLSAYLGFLWSVTRVFLRAPSGRQRFNVLGALNAVTHDIITVTNETYITAESVCTLLKKIAEKKRTTPITIVLDNARYQKCHKVVELAAVLDIELLFLPPYSPNLNLIERLWTFVREETLNRKYYPTFALFKEAIESCLVETQSLHRERLRRLFTLKFQTFKHIKDYVRL